MAKWGGMKPGELPADSATCQTLTSAAIQVLPVNVSDQGQITLSNQALFAPLPRHQGAPLARPAAPLI